jgi:hypothetical protein
MAEPAQTVKMGGFGYTTDLLNRTVNLAAGITRADEGKALTLDTSGPCKYKLAGAGDIVYGRLEVVENRENEGTLVGNAKLHVMGIKLPTTGTVAVGSFLVGSATAGSVAAQIADATTVRPSNLYAVQVEAGFAVCYTLA